MWFWEWLLDLFQLASTRRKKVPSAADEDELEDEDEDDEDDEAPIY